MTPEAISAALEKHGKWLKGEEGGVRARLIGADLTGCHLPGANLARTNFARENGTYVSDVLPALLTTGEGER